MQAFAAFTDLMKGEVKADVNAINGKGTWYWYDHAALLDVPVCVFLVPSSEAPWRLEV